MRKDLFGNGEALAHWNANALESPANSWTQQCALPFGVGVCDSQEEPDGVILAQTVGRVPLTGPGLSKNLRLNFWDLGGQKELHSLWAQYYDEAHGIIFVVDASDKARIEAVRSALGILQSACKTRPELTLTRRRRVRSKKRGSR